MKNTLSIDQLENIKASDFSSKNEFDNNVKKLVEDGFEEQTAKNLINGVARDQSNALFYERAEEQKREFLQNIISTCIVVLGSVGPILDITGLAWSICTAIISGFMGYFGFKHKIAGAITGVLMNTSLIYIIGYCLTDKASFLYVYLVVPLIFTLIPIYFIYRILTKIIS